MSRVKRIAIGVIVGAIAGLAVYVLQPVRWEGLALIQLGHIEGQPIEEVSVVFERLKSKSFIQAAVEKSGRTDLVDTLNGDRAGGLSAKAIRNSDALWISVIAPTREMAHAAVDSVASVLIDRHRTAYDRYMEDVQSRGKRSSAGERQVASPPGSAAPNAKGRAAIDDATRLVEATSVSEVPILSPMRSILLFSVIGLGVALFWIMVFRRQVK